MEGKTCRRRFVWLAPILIFGPAHIWSQISRSSLLRAYRDDDPFPSLEGSFNSSASYLIISKPQNSISISIIRQMQPATVIVAYPPSEANHVATARSKRIGQSTEFCAFDPFGDSSKAVRENFQACLNVLPQKIDGVIFNAYGAVGDGTLSQHSNLVHYKLTSHLHILQALMDQHRLTSDARIIFVGSESARGLPKMGFPVPQLGNSVDSIRSFLTGTAYDQETYRWEPAYADISAMLVLYVNSLAQSLPEMYFAVVSPGMTEESLSADNSPNPSLLWRLQLWTFRNLLFGLLYRWEIAKSSVQGASLVLAALLPSYTYPSGTFVGALGGTGGPVGDQSQLTGSRMFRDEELQKLVYQAVQHHMRS